MPQPSPEEYARFAHETLKLKASKDLEGLRILFAQNEDVLERCSTLKAEAQDMLQPQAGRDYHVLEKSIGYNLLSLIKAIRVLDDSCIDIDQKEAILSQATLYNSSRIHTLVQEAKANAEAYARAVREQAEAKARAERERAEAQARAERERAEAQARAEMNRAAAQARAERERAQAEAKQKRADLIKAAIRRAPVVAIIGALWFAVSYFIEKKQDEALQAQGMWRDADTDLIWMRCSLGQQWRNNTCEGTPNSYTWQQAQDVIGEINARQDGGFSDWRLPEIEELVTIRECSNGFSDDAFTEVVKYDSIEIKQKCNDGSQSPTINQTIFPTTTDDAYWSASSASTYGYHAWVVYFNGGHRYEGVKTDNYYVRAVRAGQ